MTLDKKGTTRFIFITGGVVSSLGKGIMAASIGVLLQSRGFKVAIRKLDPYLNVDPGTMSPTQHGEVFVTDDGAETDLDLGHYERFTGVSATKNDNVTSGKLYYSLLRKERRGDYLGQTVQVIPHVTDLIKLFILNNNADVDFVICEIGGTVGDIEGQPFLEAIRQLGYELSSNAMFVHLTLVPYVKAAAELKTKPTQHSVKELNSFGIQPDIILCRSEHDIPQDQCNKIASLCNVLPERVISAIDVDNIYKVPLACHDRGLDTQIMRYFSLKSKEPDLKDWCNIINTMQKCQKEINIAIVGKYIKHADAYKSLVEALSHAGMANNVKVNIKWLNSRIIDTKELKHRLARVEAIIIPGGFGNDGLEGKLEAITYARENNIPFLGICMGMQAAIIEFVRNVLLLEDANSVEYDAECKNPVVKLLACETINEDGWDGNMRLGAHRCILDAKSKIADIYGCTMIEERHRHRYTISKEYIAALEAKGMISVGKSEDGDVLEVIELHGHKWFIGVQFHPEFKSRPLKPHPLFVSLIASAVQNS